MKIYTYNSRLRSDTDKPLKQKTPMKKKSERFEDLLSRTLRFDTMVIKRDRCVCRLCGREYNPMALDVHHILGKNAFPEYRFILENGITLCRLCHSKVHHDVYIKNKLYEKLGVDNLHEEFMRGVGTIVD